MGRNSLGVLSGLGAASPIRVSIQIYMAGKTACSRRTGCKKQSFDRLNFQAQGVRLFHENRDLGYIP